VNPIIFVIDDEEDILELVKYNIGLEGLRAVCFTNGEQALMEIRETVPDLVALDVMLPGMNGFEVFQQIKADPRTCIIPVIMISARSEESDILAGMELGVNEYVTRSGCKTS
jgi:two-component system phosphate regulon response regulator PhoB